MANFITLIRLMLVFLIIAFALYGSPTLQLLTVPLFIIAIILDGMDGIIARARHEETLFGAVFDIAADRVIEMSMWILFIKLNIVSIWIGLIFITRGILVDSLRNQQSSRGKSPFDIMKTSWGQFLVAGRFMRFFYGTVKLFTFSWCLFLLSFPYLVSNALLTLYPHFIFIRSIFIYLTLALCLLRGIPVIWEAIL